MLNYDTRTTSTNYTLEVLHIQHRLICSMLLYCMLYGTVSNVFTVQYYILYMQYLYTVQYYILYCIQYMYYIQYCIYIYMHCIKECAVPQCVPCWCALCCCADAACSWSSKQIDAWWMLQHCMGCS